MKIKTTFSAGDIVRIKDQNVYHSMTEDDDIEIEAKVLRTTMKRTCGYFIEYLVEEKNGERYIKTDMNMKLVHKNTDVNTADSYNIEDIKLPKKGEVCLVLKERGLNMSSYRVVKFIKARLHINAKTDMERFNPECLVEFANGTRKYRLATDFFYPCCKLTLYEYQQLKDDIDEWKRIDSSFKFPFDINESNNKTLLDRIKKHIKNLF